MLSFAAHPSWSIAQLFGPKFDLPNVSHLVSGAGAGLAERLQFIFEQFDPSVTWDDAEKMITEWNGPFAIKGILSAADKHILATSR